MTEVKRKPGRPKGSKDSYPRTRGHVGLSPVATEPLLTVEQKILSLACPMKISTLSKICGMSKAHLRNKVLTGKLRAFYRSGMMLIEPEAFLEYWKGGLR
jgi:hypothetical protein